MGLLPKNERIVTGVTNKKKIWIYGQPFSGKTYLANQFPDMLLLSTDGNYTQLPGGQPPHIDIKDVVTVDGRMTKKQFAWEIFKEAISELEKKQNDFKTIVLDLLEDTYEHCRLYVFNKNSIEHESDSGYGKGWDLVKTEFLSTIKRLMNLDYENIILISHEDTSKDLTKKSGDKITAIKPNLQDKAALKIAGMVDVVARIISEDNNRLISFKTSEVIFGGGRLNVKSNEIPCSYEELIRVYNEANAGKTPSSNDKVQQATNKETNTTNTEKAVETDEFHNETPMTAPVETAVATPTDVETPEAPKTRTRKKREVAEAPTEVVPVESTAVATEPTEVPVEEEKPRRTRRVRATDSIVVNEDELPF